LSKAAYHLEITMESKSKAKSPAVPIEYAGKWIAWNHEMSQIVASARTFDEIVKAAAGETKPVFAKVPKANVRFAGIRL
jgi:hypothetical protein